MRRFYHPYTRTESNKIKEEKRKRRRRNRIRDVGRTGATEGYTLIKILK